MNETLLIVGVPHVPSYGATDADLAQAHVDFGAGSAMFGMVRAALVASAWAAIQSHACSDRLRETLAFARQNPELGRFVLAELRLWAARMFVQEWLAPFLEEKLPWLFEAEPYVCPGCYAIDKEPCAEYCPDAAIADDRLRELEDQALDFSGEDEDE